MVNYVYQPLTLGDHLAIYLKPFLPATHFQKKGNVVMIYHQENLIGINIQQPLKFLPNLKNGLIRNLSQTQIDTLNQLFANENIPFILPRFESGFKIGEIISVESHPDADALWICQVNIGHQTIQIVTNSSKVKPNNHVVVALPGAMLFDGQIIEEGMMMKEKSQGMFCSQKTLGVFPETQIGVMILPESTTIGKDFYGQ